MYRSLYCLPINLKKTIISVCPELQVKNATVSPNVAVTEGTVVTVTCKKPRRYVLMGEKYVTCQSTGWNNKPECRKCGKFQSKG